MSGKQGKRRASGDLLFAVAFLLLALFLLSQMPEQTRWIDKAKLFAQPAFWPGVGLAGMALFGAAHLFTRWRRDDLARERGEALVWVRSLEFALWFMGYVWLVPKIGYLPASLIFAPVLAYRVGYRSARMLGAAATLGLGTVLFFKTFLSVRIPGGAIYEYLPDVLRNIMITYF